MTGLSFISLFSGIEAASVAWMPLGWRAVAFAEIEPFPCAVLAHHYPDVPNVGDVLAFDWGSLRGQADVVVGGSPCQAFSVAGKRESLADARGNLTLAFVEVVDAVDPRFVVWENVPGGEPSHTLHAFPPSIAYSIVPEGGQGADLRASAVDVAPAITTEEAKSIDGVRVASTAQVRRLTPRECERLQGFPDDYTLIPVKRVRKERLLSPRAAESYVEIDGGAWQLAADGPRYRALGNSMAVPVVRWIGERIAAVLTEESDPTSGGGAPT